MRWLSSQTPRLLLQNVRQLVSKQFSPLTSSRRVPIRCKRDVRAYPPSLDYSRSLRRAARRSQSGSPG